MSTSDGKAQADTAEAALEALERAVARALERIRTLESGLEAARARRDEVEQLLARMADGEENPAHMQERLNTLEGDNAELRRRLDEGREGVERLLAKIRFLEEQR